MNETYAARLADLGDPNGYLPNSRVELLVARYPRVTPPPEYKGRSKGTRRERKQQRKQT